MSQRNGPRRGSTGTVVKSVSGNRHIPKPRSRESFPRINNAQPRQWRRQAMPRSARKRAIPSFRTRFHHAGIEWRRHPNPQCWLTLSRCGLAPVPNLRLAASTRWRRPSPGWMPWGRGMPASSERGRISGTRKSGSRSRTAPVQVSTAASGSGCSSGSAAA
jgi:hypothetical protein